MIVCSYVSHVECIILDMKSVIEEARSRLNFHFMQAIVYLSSLRLPSKEQADGWICVVLPFSWIITDMGQRKRGQGWTTDPSTFLKIFSHINLF